MSEPIIVKSSEVKERVEVEETWTYEQILDLFSEEGNLTGQLVLRCQSLEAEVERLKAELDRVEEG